MRKRLHCKRATVAFKHRVGHYALIPSCSHRVNLQQGIQNLSEPLLTLSLIYTFFQHARSRPRLSSAAETTRLGLCHLGGVCQYCSFSVQGPPHSSPPPRDASLSAQTVPPPAFPNCLLRTASSSSPLHVAPGSHTTQAPAAGPSTPPLPVLLQSGPQRLEGESRAELNRRQQLLQAHRPTFPCLAPHPPPGAGGHSSDHHTQKSRLGRNPRGGPNLARITF